MGMIAVLGAAGALGGAIVRRLAEEGRHVAAVTRRPQNAFPAGVAVRSADLFDPVSLAQAFEGAASAILVPGIALSQRAIPALHHAGVRRIVAFSSHNLSVSGAGASYQAVAEAEAQVMASGLSWTILRPTLIYGHPELAAGTALFRMAQRLPFMVTPGLGLAWQQPIFFEDLARIAVWAVFDEDAPGRVLSVGGPETLRLRALYSAASRAAGGTGLVIPAPRVLIRLAARLVGERFPITLEQIARAPKNKHVLSQEAPDAVRPRIGIKEGFAQLAASLAACAESNF
jgi:uncharacterized protein YbjT (DUF2867 family)